MGPYRRNRTAITSLVSNQSHSTTRGTISPKLRTSFFDQVPDVLNKRLILSKWCRSLSLLAFSARLLFACFSACLPPVLVTAPVTLVAWRSVNCSFVAASLSSSSSATARFDQPITSHKTEEAKYSRLERAATAVSFSSDPAPEMEDGTIGRIACSRPSRYFSTFRERFPSPAFVFWSGYHRVRELVK